MSTRKQTLIDYSILASAALAVAGAIGLAACARGGTLPSPQSPSQGVPGWQPAGAREPTPAPPAPRNDFGTPPTDGPDVPTATPPVPPSPPAPAPPPPTPAVPPAPAPAPDVPGGTSEEKVTTTTTAERKGGLIVSGNGNNLYLNSPGVTAPGPATAVQPPPQPAQALPIVPIVAAIAGTPAGQSLISGTVKRVGGALSYLATGQCPKASAAVAAAPQMFAMQSVTTLQAVPVQAVQPVQYVQAAAPQVYALPAAAPTYAVAAAPQYVQAAPQYVQAAPQPLAIAAPTPAAPKKCHWFGR